jgi:hypothetical protein
MSLAATRSSVSFELVKDAASAVVKAELAVATLNLPVHESDVISSEVLRSKETACSELERLQKQAEEHEEALTLTAAPVAALSCAASEAMAAALAAEKAAAKKSKKRKGGGGGGGGGKRKQKPAPADAVRMPREVWDRWEPRKPTERMEVDSRFSVKASSVKQAGEGLYAARALSKNATLEFMYSPTIHSRLTAALKTQYKGMLIDTGFNVNLDSSASAVSRYAAMT